MLQKALLLSSICGILAIPVAGMAAPPPTPGSGTGTLTIEPDALSNFKGDTVDITVNHIRPSAPQGNCKDRLALISIYVPLSPTNAFSVPIDYTKTYWDGIQGGKISVSFNTLGQNAKGNRTDSPVEPSAGDSYTTYFTTINQSTIDWDNEQFKEESIGSIPPCQNN